MPEELQNPFKMKGTAKILSLLQELFSLPAFGRSETGYKHFNAWLGNSSRLFQGFYITKPGRVSSTWGSQNLRPGYTAVLTTALPERSHQIPSLQSQVRHPEKGRSKSTPHLRNMMCRRHLFEPVEELK